MWLRALLEGWYGDMKDSMYNYFLKKYKNKIKSICIRETIFCYFS